MIGTPCSARRLTAWPRTVRPISCRSLIRPASKAQQSLGCSPVIPRMPLHRSPRARRRPTRPSYAKYRAGGPGPILTRNSRPISPPGYCAKPARLFDRLPEAAREKGKNPAELPRPESFNVVWFQRATFFRDLFSLESFPRGTFSLESFPRGTFGLESFARLVIDKSRNHLSVT